jgi:hypothetical protein
MQKKLTKKPDVLSNKHLNLTVKFLSKYWQLSEINGI